MPQINMPAPQRFDTGQAATVQALQGLGESLSGAIGSFKKRREKARDLEALKKMFSPEAVGAMPPSMPTGDIYTDLKNEKEARLKETARLEEKQSDILRAQEVSALAHQRGLEKEKRKRVRSLEDLMSSRLHTTDVKQQEEQRKRDEADRKAREAREAAQRVTAGEKPQSLSEIYAGDVARRTGTTGQSAADIRREKAILARAKDIAKSSGGFGKEEIPWETAVERATHDIDRIMSPEGFVSTTPVHAFGAGAPAEAPGPPGLPVAPRAPTPTLPVAPGAPQAPGVPPDVEVVDPEDGKLYRRVGGVWSLVEG